MLKKRKTWYLICGLLVCALIGMLLWTVLGPSGPIVISRETTYLTGPVGPNGQVDYWTYVETEQAKGVTLENNGVVPLLKAVDVHVWIPAEKLHYMRDQLGLAEPASPMISPEFDERFLAEARAWLADEALVQFGDTNYDEATIESALDATSYSPWQASDFPPLADWMDRNEASLDRLQDLDRCSYWYFPLDDLAEPPPRFIGEGSNWAFESRRICRMLRIRAMFHLGNDDVKKAWRDLRTELRCGQIASNMTSELDEWMRCLGIIDHAIALHQLVIHPNCDELLLQEIERQTGEIHVPYCEPGTVQFERLRLLQCAEYAYCHWDQGEEDPFVYYPWQGPFAPLPLNGNCMLRRINQWADQLETVSKTSGIERRRAVIAKIRRDFELSAWGDDPSAAWRRYASPVARARLAADLYVSESFGLLREDHGLFASEAEMRLRLIKASVALQRFRWRYGEYPATLAALSIQTPSTLPPAELSSLRYLRRDDGYLLYNFGSDSVDDQGTDFRAGLYHGRPLFRQRKPYLGGTDWSVCVPAPRFELLLEKIEEGNEMGMGISEEDLDLDEMDPPYDESDLHAEELRGTF